MEKFKKLLALSFCLVVLTALFSCSKDDDKNNNGPYDVEFKVTTSSSAAISNIIHTNASGEQTALSAVGGNTWSSKVTVKAGVPVIGINATGYSETGGTIKVQILIDGKVVQENTGSGTALTASTTYMTNAK